MSRERERRRRRRLFSPDSSRLNHLPDEILTLILSNLTLKEAARTSVLSHTWQKLWIHSTGSLNFELPRSIDQKPRFISWVNHILALHRAPTVDGFRVCYDLDETDADDIDPWIKFAMQKTVSSFELDFSHLNGLFVKDYNCYRFPSKLILDSPSRSFSSLTSLRLISVDTSDQDVAYFISNCQSLQHLAIKGAASLTCLDATAALKLKHLEIEYCHALKNVDISNTNIESLKFKGEWQTQLTELPMLTEVSLGGDLCGRVIWDSFWPLPFSQLQRLELNLDRFDLGDLMFPEVFPTLCNLKHLKVSLVAYHGQDIFFLTSLLCASPLLNSFTLKIDYLSRQNPFRFYELLAYEWRKSEKCQRLQWLKVVEFIGWYGYKSDLDLVYYLIISSAALEKVIIDPKPTNGWVFADEEQASDFAEERAEASRDRAKLLQKYVPPGMEFVIL